MNRPSTMSNARSAANLPGRRRRRVLARPSSPGTSSLAVVSVVALLASVVLGLVVAAGQVGAQGSTAVQPGEVVGAVQDTGEIVAIDEDGAVRTLVGGLNQPRAVQVLEDGSLVVAEAGANRIVGIGGRYGDSPTPIADYPFPAGLHQALDGSIYVTAFTEGKVSVVNLTSGVVTDLAVGLQTPGGLIVRNGAAYVAELNGQRVVSVDQAGRVTPTAGGFTAPLGVAGGRGAALYVADFGANEVVRVENGERAVVASVPGPRGIASDPVVPRGDEPYRLVVSTETGVSSIDPDTGEVVELASVPGVVGVTVVRGDPADAVSTTTVVGAGGTGDTSGGSSGGGGEQAGEPTGSPAAVVVLAVVILVTIGGFLYVQMRRAHAVDDDEDEERPERLDQGTLHEAFGPCVTQELEAERAQAALDAVLLQVEGLRRRVEEGELEATAARQRLAEARAAREHALAEREAAVASGAVDASEVHPIHDAEQLLTTEEGRAALAAYRSGKLGPVELANRWAEVGEEAAIARVRDAGDRARQIDPTVPGPDERQAQADVEEAETDAEHARQDLTRLAAREQECRTELAAALEALTACRDAHATSTGGSEHDPDQAAAWGAEILDTATDGSGDAAPDAETTSDPGGEGAAGAAGAADVSGGVPPSSPAASVDPDGEVEDPGFLVPPPSSPDAGPARPPDAS